MSEYDLVSVDRPDAWNRVLGRCRPFDSYHLPGYHLVAQQQGEGDPYLFVFEDRGRYAALPFLLRPVAEVDGLNECEFRDAASVYGYPGVITSVRRSDHGAEAFRDRFQAALRRAMDDLAVVALFSRGNPMIDSSWTLTPLAETVAHGPTVAIDLKQPEEERLGQFRNNHRRDIRSARRDGLVVRHDPDFEQIGTFGKLNTETMDHRGAADYYRDGLVVRHDSDFEQIITLGELYAETMDHRDTADYHYFPEQYFINLKEQLGNAVRLYVAELEGNVLSGALFLVTGGIIQYHLGGRAARLGECRGAIELIFDEVCAWGARNGFSWLHLGGGLGTREDSLFEFKAGFSKTRLQFRTFRLVFKPKTYQDLVRRRDQWVQQNGFESSTDDFFPAYRRPAIFHARISRRPLDVSFLLEQEGRSHKRHMNDKVMR